MSFKISMVFLTYNRLSTTIKCFNSLKHTLDRKDVEWIIIDNASQEATALWLYKVFSDHPQVQLFMSAINRGVAGGRDFAFDYIRGETVVSLDSDVLFTSQKVLDQLVEMIKPAEIGIAGVAGHFLLPDWSWYYPVSEGFIGEVDVVSGFCQVFRAEVLEKASLDLYYNPYWHEDSDFCLQLRQHGYNVWCNSTIGVKHIFSGSGDDGLGGVKQQYLRNKFQGKGLIAAENVTTHEE